MADYDSSLPVRTETDGDVVAAIVDKDTPANSWDIDANGAGLVRMADDDGDTIAIDANGNLSTIITDGTDQLAVNADGSINVNVVTSTAGDEVNVYATQAAGVPSTPTTVVDYTVTAAKTLLLKLVQAAASGKAKVEVKAGTSGSETVRAVAFISTAMGSVELNWPNALEVAAADKVLVVLTNTDKANQDLYARISGVEV